MSKAEPNVAIWSCGSLTVVLPHVTVAFWAKAKRGPGVSLLAEIAGEQYVSCQKQQAEVLFIKMVGGEFRLHSVDGSVAWKDKATDFLHALSTYWETRP